MDSGIDIAPVAPLDSAVFEQAHLRSYARFTHLLRWFVFHATADLVGIAGFVTGHPAVGAAFIVLGAALLVWGILTTRRAAGEGGNPAPEVAKTPHSGPIATFTMQPAERRVERSGLPGLNSPV